MVVVVGEGEGKDHLGVAKEEANIVTKRVQVVVLAAFEFCPDGVKANGLLDVLEETDPCWSGKRGHYRPHTGAGAVLCSSPGTAVDLAGQGTAQSDGGRLHPFARWWPASVVPT